MLIQVKLLCYVVNWFSEDVTIETVIVTLTKYGTMMNSQKKNMKKTIFKIHDGFIPVKSNH